MFNQTLPGMLFQKTVLTMRQRVCNVTPDVVAAVMCLEHVHPELLLGSPGVATNFAIVVIKVGIVVLQTLHVWLVATGFTASFSDGHDTTDSLSSKEINPIPKVVLRKFPCTRAARGNEFQVLAYCFQP